MTVRCEQGRPDLLERASTAENTKFYQLQFEEQSGIKHLGLPSGFANGGTTDENTIE